MGTRLPAATFSSKDAPSSRVLVIGIDGLRPDALAAARTPNLDRLIRNGAFSDTTQILGERYRANDTISGPGWSSFLTGVWADKHGVHDNSFEGKDYDRYPHFFSRLKQRFPQARTGSFVDWAPIDTHVVTGADVKKVYPANGAENYSEQDSNIARDAAAFLAQDDPHATMVYFGAIDETGHKHGFHPTVSQYIQAIEKIDGHVGQLVQAMQGRANFTEEDWLVVVSTDHGGRGTGHGGGHDVPEIRTTFLIVSGPSAVIGKLEKPTYVVDAAVTALAHLGVASEPEWKLDGLPVGLKKGMSNTQFGGVRPRIIIQEEEELTLEPDKDR